MMMYYNTPFNIPLDLLDYPKNQVSIIVGENGSGKSSLLRELSRYFAYRGNRKVIGIANTIYDKFDFRHPNFETLKASHGKSIVKRTLKLALQLITNKDDGRFYQAAETLKYVNFDPIIGLKVVGLKGDFSNALRYGDLSEEQGMVISALLERYQHRISYNDDWLRIDLYRNDFFEFKDSGVLELLQFESLLKKLKIIKEIEVFLQKDGHRIPINQSSSGELTLITSFIYLMSTIREGTIILIDEPENSLHPKWQVEYVKKLYDLVYRYEPAIYIATHSPLIVNSAEIELGSRVGVYKGNGNSFIEMPSIVNNVEEIYQDLFDITTPENRFLSQFVVKKLNQLATNTITLNQFEQLIFDLSENAYDPRQKQVLDGVIVMGRNINERRENNGTK